MPSQLNSAHQAKSKHRTTNYRPKRWAGNFSHPFRMTFYCRAKARVLLSPTLSNLAHHASQLRDRSPLVRALAITAVASITFTGLACQTTYGYERIPDKPSTVTSTTINVDKQTTSPDTPSKRDKDPGNSGRTDRQSPSPTQSTTGSPRPTSTGTPSTSATASPVPTPPKNDTQSHDEEELERPMWLKCSVGTSTSAFGGAVAAATLGSAVPGLGTVSGALIGGISAGAVGAAANCFD